MSSLRTGRSRVMLIALPHELQMALLALLALQALNTLTTVIFLALGGVELSPFMSALITALPSGLTGTVIWCGLSLLEMAALAALAALTWALAGNTPLIRRVVWLVIAVLFLVRTLETLNNLFVIANLIWP